MQRTCTPVERAGMPRYHRLCISWLVCTVAFERCTRPDNRGERASDDGSREYCDAKKATVEKERDRTKCRSGGGVGRVQKREKRERKREREKRRNALNGIANWLWEGNPLFPPLYRLHPFFDATLNLDCITVRPFPRCKLGDCIELGYNDRLDRLLHCIVARRTCALLLLRETDERRLRGVPDIFILDPYIYVRVTECASPRCFNYEIGA